MGAEELNCCKIAITLKTTRESAFAALPQVAVDLQDSQDGSDRVPVPCRGGRAVEFVDLAEVADGLHVAPVHAKHELAFGRHQPHQ
jgi:hypothetical protein